jgi:hypothetical protein
MNQIIFKIIGILFEISTKLNILISWNLRFKILSDFEKIVSLYIHIILIKN